MWYPRSMRRLILFALPALLTLLDAAVPLVPTGGTAQAAQYVIEKEGPGNEVVFESKAPLDSFVGKTSRVWGAIDADLSQLSGPVAVTIVVDLASLDTGIKKRNRHMCENHLETDTHPRAVFKAGRIVSASAPSLTPGVTTRIRLAGTFDLHGVECQTEYDVDLTLEDDGSLLVVTTFPVSLETHKIKRPKFLIMKLADEQKVTVSLRANPAAGNDS